MSSPDTLIVMNIAALSEGLLKSGACPNLEAFARANSLNRIRPVLPALTLPMQATFMTGRVPAGHGIVGNGFFDRTRLEHCFWEASSFLLDSPAFWRTEEGKRYRAGALFWWNCLGGRLDAYCNVAPFHLASGETVSSCYSDPPSLYHDLEKDLGPFPLHRFWGPGVSIESSDWILKATLHTAEKAGLDVLLAYIPHMDYSQQRSGPDSEETRRHLSELDGLLADPLERALDNALNLVILSDYGITPVKRALSPNLFLKRDGFFRVRPLGRREYPDLPGSRAFALCDHQVAHVYIRDEKDLGPVFDFLRGLEGVGEVLNARGKADAGLDHRRTGDLVLLSDKDGWFDYRWWEDEECAPDYAFTVDIHRKIGYDPLELILDPAEGRIASDPGLIRGSHGLLPEKDEDHPIVIMPFSDKDILHGESPIPARDVRDAILKLLARRGGMV